MQEKMAAIIRDTIRECVDAHLRDLRSDLLAIDEKAPHDLVSSIDVAIGTELSTRLTDLIPGSNVFTEDGTTMPDASVAPASAAAVPPAGPGGGTRPAASIHRASRRWIIDPIDGTANLIMGNAHFGTSVALEEDGLITAGFVYQPATGRMYWSIAPGQAFVNESELRPSRRSRMEESLVVFGFSANLPNIQRYHHEWTTAFERSRKAIGLLAPALNICSVAEGFVDAFIDFGCSMEGQAAAGLILRNAGGELTDYDGRPWDHVTTGVYAGNGVLDRVDLVRV